MGARGVPQRSGVRLRSGNVGATSPLGPPWSFEMERPYNIQRILRLQIRSMVLGVYGEPKGLAMYLYLHLGGPTVLESHPTVCLCFCSNCEPLRRRRNR